ncbi:MAG: phospholipid/cholesterol/gamma-HCH transport system permease protein [Kiritimatiellia bacterium]|jgi:phospholipid/cholesterol/gamma-HCH transport system permease protein
MFLVRMVEGVGRSAFGLVEEFGRMARVTWGGISNVFLPPFRFGLTVRQMEFIGVQSLPIIALTAFFTGAVFTLQSYRAFALFGAEGYVGGTVGISLAKELGPTLTGLLVAGRAGSAMAAEIGAMRVSEQIDALEAMAIDPMNYLVKPRLLAALFVTPLLTAIFDIVGVVGSYVVAIYVLGMDWPMFAVRLQEWVDWPDIAGGLVKGFAFGGIIAIVACYMGLYTQGGAQGVGRSTTRSVVISSVMILVSNYFMTAVLP